MTDLTKVIVAVVWENQQPWIFARVSGADGAYVNQASTSSVTFSIRDKLDPQHETAGDTLDKTAVIFDSLVTNDPRWTVDSTGYNVRHRVPPDAIPDGGHEYIYEMLIYDTAAEPDFAAVVVDIQAKNLLSL
jgi:hypothetical protein